MRALLVSLLTLCAVAAAAPKSCPAPQSLIPDAHNEPCDPAKEPKRCHLNADDLFVLKDALKQCPARGLGDCPYKFMRRPDGARAVLCGPFLQDM